MAATKSKSKPLSLSEVLKVCNEYRYTSPDDLNPYYLQLDRKRSQQIDISWVPALLVFFAIYLIPISFFITEWTTILVPIAALLAASCAVYGVTQQLTLTERHKQSELTLTKVSEISSLVSIGNDATQVKVIDKVNEFLTQLIATEEATSDEHKEEIVKDFLLKSASLGTPTLKDGLTDKAYEPYIRQFLNTLERTFQSIHNGTLNEDMFRDYYNSDMQGLLFGLLPFIYAAREAHCHRLKRRKAWLDIMGKTSPNQLRIYPIQTIPGDDLLYEYVEFYLLKWQYKMNSEYADRIQDRDSRAALENNDLRIEHRRKPLVRSKTKHWSFSHFHMTLLNAYDDMLENPEEGKLTSLVSIHIEELKK